MHHEPRAFPSGYLVGIENARGFAVVKNENFVGDTFNVMKRVGNENN